MKLLFISYYFPPTKSIACVRAYNICYEFLKHFKVWVFSTSNTKNFLKDDYPDLPIERVTLLKTWDVRTLISKKPVRNKMNKDGISLTFKLLWSFPLNVIIGIGGLVYIINGYRKGIKLIRKEGITHLYSSFYPYSDHYIAYLLKKKFPNLKWIADFRDLHLDNKHIIWPRVQERWNKRILKNADVVTTVSNGLKGALEKLHQNVIVVRNGIGALNENIKKDLVRKTQEKFLINYTGNLIPNERIPDRLMQAIRNLMLSDSKLKDKIILQYAGNHYEEWKERTKKFQIDEISRTNSLIPLKEAYQRQLNAAVNILLTSSTEGNRGILTGKFYEYLNAGRPVLVIIKGDKDDEFEDIVEELGAGMVVYHDEKEVVYKIEEFLLELLEQWQLGKLEDFSYSEKIKEYTMEYQMEKIASFFG